MDIYTKEQMELLAELKESGDPAKIKAAEEIMRLSLQVSNLFAEKEAGKFWADLFKDSGDPEYDSKPLREKIELELSDYHRFIDGIPRVFMAVTGDHISKPNTDPDAVIGAFNDHVEDLIRDAIRDDNRNKYDILMAAIEEAFGPDPRADDVVDDGVVSSPAPLTEPEYYICPKARECNKYSCSGRQALECDAPQGKIICKYPDGELKKQNFACVRCDKHGNPLPKVEQSGIVEEEFLTDDTAVVIGAKVWIDPRDSMVYFHKGSGLVEYGAVIKLGPPDTDGYREGIIRRDLSSEPAAK